MPARADGGARVSRWRRRRRSAPDVSLLVDTALGAGDPTGWFDPLYVEVARDASLLPWHADGAHPYLVDWLDTASPPPRPAHAVVVGCGLGDDAAELARRGWRVTAIDVAPTAIAWARDRHRGADIDWRVADVLALPDELRGAADLLVEVHTVDHLPGVVRDAAMQSAAAAVAPSGTAVVVTLLATRSDLADGWQGPPWAQAPSELAAYRAGGLLRVGLDHPDPDARGGMEVRLVFARTPAG